MTWLTLRQLRIPAAVVHLALAAIGCVLIVTTRAVTETTVYALASASVVALPAVLGVFWAAPLIARELETGTYRLAWTQSITRTRWLATKLGLGTLAAMLAAAALSLGATWWSAPIDTAINAGRSFQGILSVSRMEPPMFIARGIAPVGHAAFAFVLGATAGLLLRRTIPAMAVTLVVFAGVQLAMPLVRAQLAPERLTTTITQDNLAGLILTDPGAPVQEVRVAVDAPGAWVTQNSPVDPSGRLVDTLPGWFGGCVPAPEQRSDPKGCFTRLAEAGYRQRVSYQPAGRYWTFQAIETATFVALAAALAGVCFWRVRRLG